MFGSIGMPELIIIFVIITPFAPHGEEATIPQPAKTNEPPRPDSIVRTVVLQVLDNPQGKTPLLKVNEDPVAWAELRARLASIYQFRNEKVIFVRADEDIEWQNVAEAISQAHIAGVAQVALISPRPHQSRERLLAAK